MSEPQEKISSRRGGSNLCSSRRQAESHPHPGGQKTYHRTAEAYLLKNSVNKVSERPGGIILGGNLESTIDYRLPSAHRPSPAGSSIKVSSIVHRTVSPSFEAFPIAHRKRRRLMEVSKHHHRPFWVTIRCDAPVYDAQPPPLGPAPGPGHRHRPLAE
jgi:hypothetical protein